MPTASPPKSTIASAEANGSGALTFLKAKQLWRPEAPAAVRNAWKADDHSAAWQAWRSHLAERPALEANPSLAKGKKAPSLCWGLPAPTGERLADWLKSGPLNRNHSAEAASSWVGGAGEQEADVEFGLQAIAWAVNLPSLAAKLSSDVWWSLAETLLRIVEEASATAAPDAAEAEATVAAQLLTGELPLALSRGLGELRPMHELGAVARTSLSEGIERLTDGEGLLAGPLWADHQTPAASLLLACWTRCQALAARGKAPWTSDAQTQYEWLVRQALRLSDRQGRLAFTPANTTGAAELIRAALSRGGDDSDRAAAALRLKGYKASDKAETPAVCNHSEWAELGVLAAGWRDKAPRIVVAHPADTMRVEVHSGKQTLLAGDWPIEASIDGEAVRSTDDWDVQCWYTDEDGDYLELSLPLVGGARLERQFFVSREDGVGFLGETLFTEQSDEKQLSITSRLPLGEAIGIRPEKETREAVLSLKGEPVAGVVPLALAEWRDDPRGGELTAEDKCLVLTRQWSGRNAVSTLWFDFSAKRFDKQRTWRQLAVAESLKNVTHDVAVAYRIQSNKEQWVIYRSLDKAGNRTFLGQNYSSEQVVGLFNPDTHLIDEYFEIEADE